jgi:hypothetical protein
LRRSSRGSHFAAGGGAARAFGSPATLQNRRPSHKTGAARSKHKITVAATIPLAQACSAGCHATTASEFVRCAQLTSTPSATKQKHFRLAYATRLSRDATSARPHPLSSIDCRPKPLRPCRAAALRTKSVSVPRTKKNTGTQTEIAPAVAKKVK